MIGTFPQGEEERNDTEKQVCVLPMLLPAEKLPLYPVYTGITLLAMTLFIRRRRAANA